MASREASAISNLIMRRLPRRHSPLTWSSRAENLRSQFTKSEISEIYLLLVSRNTITCTSRDLNPAPMTLSWSRCLLSSGIYSLRTFSEA